MNYLRIALAGAVGAALGWLVAIGVAWLRGVWDFPGGLSTMALFGYGPPGAFFGLVLGIALLLYVRNRSDSFFDVWDRVLNVTAIIVVLIAGAIFIVLHNLEVIASR